MSGPNEYSDEFTADFDGRILSPLPTPAEGAEMGIGQGRSEQIDRALRPQAFEEFIGQDSLKANLSVFVAAARQRQDALDHLLLFGPPGLGKTTLAQIVAREAGVGFKSTSGPVIAKAADLAAVLTSLEPRDVLFIDEIHRLPPQVEEVLYPAMEDYALDLMIGEGPSARNVRIDLAPFTLVGATTRSGMLSTPLRDRFGIVSRLEFYDPAQLSIIVLAAARKLSLEITEDGAMEIARRARGTPRIAMRLLRRVRDFAQNAGGPLDKKLADHALMRLDISADGLDSLDRRYLSALINNYGGGPVGVETLAAVLSEARDGLEDVIEPYLMQQGYIHRSPRGRMATPLAYQLFGLASPSINGQDNGDLFPK